jgi:hypothetical protein
MHARSINRISLWLIAALAVAGLLLAPLCDVALADESVPSDPMAEEVPADVYPPKDGGGDPATEGFGWGG